MKESKKRDLALIERAKKGDQKAYARLMELYYDHLHAALNKKLRNTFEVEEVASQAFHKAFKKLELYNPTYAFSTWLYRIAYNQMIDYIRKYKFERSWNSLVKDQDGEWTQLELESHVDDPEEKMIRRQRKEAVHQLIQQLPENYREVIELRYLQEMSYREIANELDIPEGTVKAKLFRARKALVEIFKLNNYTG